MVTKLLRGLEPLSSHGRAKLYDARAALEKIYLGQRRLSAADEQARLAKEKADAQALKNARERGELVGADGMDRGLIALASMVGTRFQLLGVRTARALAAETTPIGCQKIVDEAVEAALLELSQAGEEASSRVKAAGSGRATAASR